MTISVHRTRDSGWLLTAVSCAAGVVVLGILDYATGYEIRMFPLYYVPVSVAAWRIGRAPAVLIAMLCAASWVVANQLAGLQYSHVAVWAVNTGMQGGSFILVGVMVDAMRASRDREAALSRTDGLTDLLNARAFDELARQLVLLARRQGRPLTIAYLDLDNFKSVNDIHGHGRGDAVLVQLADLLRRSTRASDVVARMGGDEFVLLMPDTSADGARVILERLRAEVATRFASVAVTASIGGVTFETPPRDFDDLIRRADQLLYEAKAAGKGRVVLDTAA